MKIFDQLTKKLNLQNQKPDEQSTQLIAGISDQKQTLQTLESSENTLLFTKVTHLRLAMRWFKFQLKQIDASPKKN